MLNIIKTAIITIIISFISGVLLDYYKNYAPRIVCNIGRTRVIKRENKKEKVYLLTVTNISKKTIHNLNINITANSNTIKLHNSKIAKGLRFEVTNENNMYNVLVPFLSKNDEFSTKVLLEEDNGLKARPSISLRSPENFKRIDKSKADPFKSNNKIKKSDKFEEIFFRNRKVIIGVLSILIFAFIGIVVKEYYGTLNKDIKIYENNNTNKSSNILNSPSINSNSSSSTGTSTNSNVNTNYNTENVVPAENSTAQNEDGARETINNNDNIDSTYSPSYNNTLNNESGTNEETSSSGAETPVNKPTGETSGTSNEDNSGNTPEEKSNNSTEGTSENEDKLKNNQSSEGTSNNNSSANTKAGEGNSTENPQPSTPENQGTGNESSGGSTVTTP